MTVQRLDVALVEAGLARSRTHARRIIDEGRARIDGSAAVKPSTPVPPGARLESVDVPDGVEYASRAAHKLTGALDALGIDPAGKRCLDAGASTGGFTDVLLRRGAASVAAVDIGRGQLDERIAADSRVTVHDGTSVRGLRPEGIGGAVELTVGDLSFISLTTVLDDLARCTLLGGELLVMVKPQFEVGRSRLPRGGVVKDPRHRRDAVRGVADRAARAGLRTVGAGCSPLPGQDGNIELFLHLVHDGCASEDASAAYDMIESALAAAPRRTARTAADPGEAHRR